MNNLNTDTLSADDINAYRINADISNLDQPRTNKLKIALIGCGRISPVHLNAIADCPDACLYAVCDIDKPKALAAAGKYGCKAYFDYKELLQDESIDVVHICTPNWLHSFMSIDAMLAGKHVLTEKPMAIAPSDASEMIRVSEKTGKKLGVCFQNRYNSTSLRIKELLDSGKSGRIIGSKAFITWSRDRNYYESDAWRGTWNEEGGGVIISQAVHALDLLQWFNGDAEKLKASIDTRLLEGVIEVEDTADAVIVFRNGSTALFYATNCYCANSPVRLEIICENATIILDEDLTVKYKNGETEKPEDVDSFTGGKSYWGCSHKTLIHDFYRSVINRKDFFIDGKQGIASVKLVNAFYESHRKNSFMTI
jgi:UDP-N-acetyl-2-amino-2-deoxyglucuronate dehydrogenase